MNNKIAFIDPGPVQSALVVWDGVKILHKEINPNPIISISIHALKNCVGDYKLGIEMTVNYAKFVGEKVHNTTRWIGKFERDYEIATVRTDGSVLLITRPDIKLHLCNTKRSTGAGVSAALQDRFGVKGVKKEPGFFYGFKEHMWAAFAGAVFVWDTMEK